MGSVPYLSPASRGLPAMCDDVPWLGAISLHSLPPSSPVLAPCVFSQVQIQSLGKEVMRSSVCALSSCGFFFFKIYLFMYFTFGCTGSSLQWLLLLHELSAYKLQ